MCVFIYVWFDLVLFLYHKWKLICNYGFFFHSQRVIMEGDGSPLSSLCMVRAAELFPKPEPEREEESLKVPFSECNLK